MLRFLSLGLNDSGFGAQGSADLEGSDFEASWGKFKVYGCAQRQRYVAHGHVVRRTHHNTTHVQLSGFRGMSTFANPKS